MGIFGGGNSSSTENNYDNRLQNVGSGNIIKGISFGTGGKGGAGATQGGTDKSVNLAGSSSYIQSDHGAIKSGLDAVKNIVSETLKSNTSVNINSLNKSLDFGSHALDKSSETFNASLNSVVQFADKILRNGATATKNAMSLAKYSTTDNTQKNTDLMIKVAAGLAGLTVIFMFYSASKKR